MSDYLFEIQNISKYYPGVKALDDVSFNIQRGSCHCLLGENGAGKSTMIKVLTGAEKRTSGTILYKGVEFEPQSTRDSMAAGVGCLFQELNVVDQLKVIENISLGLEKTKAGVMLKSDIEEKVLQALEKMDPSINPNSYVEDLSVAQKQVIEISKALAMDSDIIIMDEPTASLSESEVRRLFEIIAELKSHGVTIIYISHRLDEIFEIGDYMTVLRDGKLVGTKQRDELKTRKELIKMMIGKELVEDYFPNKVDKTVKILEAQNIRNRRLKDISFDLYKGEILGFYGLVGAGKTEIARALFGVDEMGGSIRIMGEEKHIHSAAQAIKEGVVLVPEERRTEGLCTELTIADNIPQMNYRTITQGGFTRKTLVKKLAKNAIADIGIACRNSDQMVASLSGGNQQKVVFAKCLNSKPKILLLDEPTRGVDVGAKQEIYQIVRTLAKEGNAIIVFSSELPEILGLCDRIILLNEGSIVEELANTPDLDTRKIMHMVTGGSKDE